jgi:uncharacterized protein involved in type VI secretion and phage assembly
MPIRLLGRRSARSRIDEYTLGYARGWSEGHARGYAAGRRAALVELKADLDRLALALGEVGPDEEERPETEPPSFLLNVDEETIARAHRLSRSG